MSRSITRLAKIAAAAATLLATQLPLQAATMYSTGGNGTQLWAIDTVTGTGTLVGPTGRLDDFGAAFGPDGNLYTVYDSYNTSGTLGRFDLTTGAVTPVTGAAVGIADLMVLEFGPDGTFYAGSWNTNTLYRMSLATGLPTAIGPLGFSNVMDFAFDSKGTMWAVADTGLYTIDLSTGAGTFRTALPTLTCSMGIAFDASDQLFATNYCESNSGLFRIDTVTGVPTLIGYTGINAPHGGDIAAIPEPGSMALLGIGLAGLAALQRRRAAKR